MGKRSMLDNLSMVFKVSKYRRKKDTVCKLTREEISPYWKGMYDSMFSKW